MGGYEDAYGYWRQDPEGFWRAASSAIEWDRLPESIIDRSHKPSPAWFPGGRLNTCLTRSIATCETAAAGRRR